MKKKIDFKLKKLYKLVNKKDVNLPPPPAPPGNKQTLLNIYLYIYYWYLYIQMKNILSSIILSFESYFNCLKKYYVLFCFFRFVYLLLLCQNIMKGFETWSIVSCVCTQSKKRSRLIMTVQDGIERDKVIK